MSDCPLEIGNYVTIGHEATIHCKKIGDNSLIGMGAILLGYSEIGHNCIIAAGALVTEGFVVPPYSMVMGVPGKIVRELTEEEAAAIHQTALNYYNFAQNYRK
jgi:carbonic anhydrase/acetyltransferase-like protein (isoleucine patch superfamily)